MDFQSFQFYCYLLYLIFKCKFFNRTGMCKVYIWIELTLLNMWVFESSHLDTLWESYALLNFLLETIIPKAIIPFNRKTSETFCTEAGLAATWFSHAGATRHPRRHMALTQVWPGPRAGACHDDVSRWAGDRNRGGAAVLVLAGARHLQLRNLRDLGYLEDKVSLRGMAGKHGGDEVRRRWSSAGTAPSF